MPDDLPRNFCVMPFLGLHISAQGAIAPCCEYAGDWGNVDDISFAEARRSPKAKAEREAFAKGRGDRLKACWKCFEREASGAESLRNIYNRNHAAALKVTDSADGSSRRFQMSEGPAFLDIRFSNLCNFKCRSCWHGSSSSWFKDARSLGAAQSDKAEIRSIKSFDHLMGQIGPNLDHVEAIYFAGGEPLMIAENYRLLELLIEQNRTDVKLSYNTNGSLLSLGKSSMLDLWPHFPNVTVELSVDATKPDAAALIRSGFLWDDFVKNAKAIRDTCPHVLINFGITASALNITQLTQTLSDLKDHCGAMPGDLVIHALQMPEHLQIAVLPAQVKQDVASKLQTFKDNLDPNWGTAEERGALERQLQGMLHELAKPAENGAYQRFCKSQKRLDDLRKEDVADILPELFPNGMPTDPTGQKATLVDLAKRGARKLKRHLSR